MDFHAVVMVMLGTSLNDDETHLTNPTLEMVRSLAPFGVFKLEVENAK